MRRAGARPVRSPAPDSTSPREGIPLFLNAGERRGALVVLLLLAIGTGHDLWRARRTSPMGPGGPAAAARETAPDRAGASRAGPVHDEGSEDAPARAVSDSAAAGGAPEDRAGAVLDLNRVGAAELDALPGIGPVLARRIVEHRTRHGPFQRVEELRAVRGVGPRLMARLRPHLRVGGTKEGP